MKVLVFDLTGSLKRYFCTFVVIAFAAGCTGDDSALPVLPGDAQAISLLGDTLYPPPLIPEVRETRERQLAEARAAYEADPIDPDSAIWLGRRTAYVGQYREAVEIFAAGIQQHESEARLYRHRGHRFITLRMFQRAMADLEHAARLTNGQPDRVEPDGLPNALNIPTSTLQTNIWYHLGLAHYLEGDFESAAEAYRECIARADNPDMLVATSHWWYMALRRLGREDEAAQVLEPITSDLDIIENHSYHRLLLMYKGELPADSLLAPGDDAIQNATVAYGVANWHYYNGRTEQAQRMLREVLQGTGWPAFGFIAAEADVARVFRRE